MTALTGRLRPRSQSRGDQEPQVIARSLLTYPMGRVAREAARHMLLCPNMRA